MNEQNWKTSKLLYGVLAILLFATLFIPSSFAQQGAEGNESVAAQQEVAQNLPKQPFLPLSLASAGAAAALESCAADGFAVSVAIVDAAGVLKVQLRADGAGPHTLGSSDGKAYTAASLKRATLGLANFLADRPDLDELRDMDDRILILGGGLPIEVDGHIVGGIGVGGAPGGDIDEACAQDGIDRIIEILERNGR